MEPFDFWKIYKAVHLHFIGGSYDYFKYGGRTKLTEDHFNGFKDKYIFSKLAKKFNSDNDATMYIASNFFEDPKLYIRSFDQDLYIKWQKYSASLYYDFANEFKQNKWVLLPNRIIEHLEANYGQSRFPFELFILTNAVLDNSLIEKLNKEYGSHVIWEDIGKKIELVKPFIINCWNIDKEKLKGLKRIIGENI